MARERIVSRTINVLCATALCVEVSTQTTKNVELELTGVGELSSEQILKALRKEYETDNLKVVTVLSTSKREELYGMREVDFLKYAHRLDPQTRKALAEDSGENFTISENPVSAESTTLESDIEVKDETTSTAPIAPKKPKKGGRK